MAERICRCGPGPCAIRSAGSWSPKRWLKFADEEPEPEVPDEESNE